MCEWYRTAYSCGDTIEKVKECDIRKAFLAGESIRSCTAIKDPHPRPSSAICDDCHNEWKAQKQQEWDKHWNSYIGGWGTNYTMKKETEKLKKVYDERLDKEHKELAKSVKGRKFYRSYEDMKNRLWKSAKRELYGMQKKAETDYYAQLGLSPQPATSALPPPIFQQDAYAQQDTFAQPPAYDQQQQQPYAQPDAYSQQAAYAQQDAYTQQQPYAQQDAHAQQAAYPQQGAYTQQDVYAQQQSYAQQDPYAQQSTEQVGYVYASQSSASGSGSQSHGRGSGSGSRSHGGGSGSHGRSSGSMRRH